MLAAAPIIFLVTFSAKGPGFQEMACSLLVNLRKGMQSLSEQQLVGDERYVTTLITAAKETKVTTDFTIVIPQIKSSQTMVFN